LYISGALSIGLSLLGAFGVIFNVGDWGWLIGSVAGAIVYLAVSQPAKQTASVPAGI